MDPRPRDEQDYAGRLELTWTNKDRALLLHDDGSCEWVAKRDYRVAEVRLLREAGTVGQVHPAEERAQDNLLIRGDSLHALSALARLPEFAAEYAGKVKLAYLAPPFNTGQKVADNHDGLVHSVRLSLLRDRLVQVRDLLAPDGSVWVHLDDAEVAFCRLLLEEVFGQHNFVGTVIWQKTTSRENQASLSTAHDYILVFARDHKTWQQTRNLVERGEKLLKGYQNPDNDPRGSWTSSGLIDRKRSSSGANQHYDIVSPTGQRFSPPPGRAWLYSESRYRELRADNRIWFGRDGTGHPRVKTFLSEAQPGVVPTTWWSADDVGHNRQGRKELLALCSTEDPPSTVNPEALQQRIIHIASNPGDIVLDCFAYSGTTSAVAHKMGRRWVALIQEPEAFKTYLRPRLSKVIRGQDRGGISEAVGWKRGGGYRLLDIAPSIYEDDNGLPVLADWATQGELAEAVAAQLGFTYEVEGPFCGRRGRARLAVVDGHADTPVAELMLRTLEGDETLVLCATSLDPEVDELLGKRSPGSVARAIPQDLLRPYRAARD